MLGETLDDILREARIRRSRRDTHKGTGVGTSGVVRWKAVDAVPEMGDAHVGRGPRVAAVVGVPGWDWGRGQRPGEGGD